MLNISVSLDGSEPPLGDALERLVGADLELLSPHVSCQIWKRSDELGPYF